MVEGFLNSGMLSPYRVLDLTDERGFLVGRLLGDLGADVVKIENPGGDPSRNTGPFYHDEPDPEKSLYWWAFNNNKRGITLDLEKHEGQKIFKKLVENFDIVIESFNPGYLDSLGLGYTSLKKINKRIIMASVTGFGQEGPYRDYKATDLVVWALSGMMYLHGDPDRAPLAPSFPIGYTFAQLQLAIGIMISLYQRDDLGEGQYIDAPSQLSLVWPTEPEYQGAWEQDKVLLKRSGRSWLRAQSGVLIPVIYPCKDGAVTFFPFLGPSRIKANIAFAGWMESEGFHTSFKNIDYGTTDWQNITQDCIDEWTGDFARFFMTQTKKQLLEGAAKRDVIMYPEFTPKDMFEFDQLTARGFWVEVEHPELGTKVTYPGSFVKTTGPALQIRRRAPLIGEHNIDLYVEEMGYSKEELRDLNRAGVI
jgi:benzylsuccinate CoA-transferase BbsE subunit